MSTTAAADGFAKLVASVPEDLPIARNLATVFALERNQVALTALWMQTQAPWAIAAACLMAVVGLEREVQTLCESVAPGPGSGS